MNHVRLGGRQASILAIGSTVAVAAPLGLFDGTISFVGMWLLVSTTYGYIALNLQRLAAVAVPENRGGALSSVLAFRFLGHAAGPLVFVPMLEWSAPVAFAAAASLGLITLGVYVSAEPVR